MGRPVGCSESKLCSRRAVQQLVTHRTAVLEAVAVLGSSCVVSSGANCDGLCCCICWVALAPTFVAEWIECGPAIASDSGHAVMVCRTMV